MKTNSLKFTDNRTDKNGNQWEIKIRLDDECKNGYQEFSITGTCWEKGKPKVDKYLMRGGACGDTIAELFPEYEIFNRLHLCDYKGMPMYCAENMFYFLKNGFNSGSTGEQFINEFCKYYRLTKEEFFKIYKAQSVTHFCILLEQSGIFEKWEKEAKKAIKLLEELTGNEFIIDSVKSQYNRPEQSKIFEELQKIENGFYSDEAIKQREIEQDEKDFLKIEEEEAKEIEKIKLEYTVKKIIFRASKKAFKNFIFYNHTKQIKFNWTNTNKQLTTEEIEAVKKEITNLLPDGVTFHN